MSVLLLSALMWFSQPQDVHTDFVQVPERVKPPIKVSVFPNPSPDGLFTIQLSRTVFKQAVQVRVFNLLGEEIWYREIAEGVLFIELELNLTEFPRGAYMLEINHGGEKQSSRLSYY